MAAHAKFDYFAELRKHGITGEISKIKPYPMLSGWYNNIKTYGYYFCDDPKDTQKALEIFTQCGFNDCEIKGNRCIEIRNDTRK